MEEVEGEKRETIKRPIEYARVGGVGGVLLTNTRPTHTHTLKSCGKRKTREREREQSTNCDDEMKENEKEEN